MPVEAAQQKHVFPERRCDGEGATRLFVFRHVSVFLSRLRCPHRHIASVFYPMSYLKLPPSPTAM